MAKHSDIGASSAHRWLACPGSVALIATVPRGGSSTYADEGTIAHEVAQCCLVRKHAAEHYLGWCGWINEKGGVGLTADMPGRNETLRYQVEVGDEMVASVQVYLDTIWNDFGEAFQAEMFVEQKFDLNWLAPGMFGRNDCCIAEAFGTLRVYDLKYGRGHVVEVEGNPQLRYYALGAAGKGNPHGFTDVEICIVQPRAYHADGPVRRERLTAAELYDWGQSRLLPGAEATKDPSAPLLAGEHCLFCPARAVCPAQAELGNALARNMFSAVPDDEPLTVPSAMTDEDLRRVLEQGPAVKAWIDECFAYTQGRLEAGEKVEGWKLVRKRANRRWIDEDRTKAKMAHVLRDKAYNLVLKSPAQMEKTLKAEKLDPKLVTELVETPLGSLALAPADDPRPAAVIEGFKPIEEDWI